MGRGGEPWRTSLIAPQQPRNPQPEAIARNPYQRSSVMPFALRITKSRPNLARVIPTTDPTPVSAASPLVFWRGAALGFASAMVVFDFFFLNGTTLARLVSTPSVTRSGSSLME